MVADALSRKSQVVMASAITTQKELLMDLEKMGIEFREYQPNALLSAIKIQHSIIDEIKVAQKEDKHLQAIIERTKEAYQSDAMLSAIEIQPSILDEIKAAQKEDEYLQSMIERTKETD